MTRGVQLECGSTLEDIDGGLRAALRQMRWACSALDEELNGSDGADDARVRDALSTLARVRVAIAGAREQIRPEVKRDKLARLATVRRTEEPLPQ